MGAAIGGRPTHAYEQRIYCPYADQKSRMCYLLRFFDFLNTMLERNVGNIYMAPEQK